jgi:hypothetical protein
VAIALVIAELQQGRAIVDKDGRPTAELLRTINGNNLNIRNFLVDLIDLNDLITTVEAAAATANTAAAAANTAATAAQETADDITNAQSLANSYVSGLTLGATDAGASATVTISAHTRHYPQPNGTTVNVSVNGGSLTAQPYSSFIYVYYDDPGRAGGAVTYQGTTDEATAAQIGARHTVGGTPTPAALGAPETGKPTRPPGSGTVSIQ